MFHRIHNFFKFNGILHNVILAIKYMKDFSVYKSDILLSMSNLKHRVIAENRFVEPYFF